MESSLDQTQFRLQDVEWANGAMKEREAAADRFVKAHLCVLALLSAVQLFWLSLVSEPGSELIQLSLGTALVPLLCLGSFSGLPRAVITGCPLLCNFVYAGLAVHESIHSLYAYMLSGYVHQIVCMTEYALSPTQAYISMAIYALTWAGVLGYAQVGPSTGCELVSLLGVMLVTTMSVAHRYQEQQATLTRRLNLERKQRNIQNLLNNISENIAVLNLECGVLMKNRGFAGTFPGENFVVVASKVAVNHQTNWSMLNEIEEFICQDKHSANFQATTNEVVYSCSLYKVRWEHTDCVAFVSQDITQSIRWERMYSKSEGVSATLRSVTHEIKTPVNYLLHSLESVCQFESSLSDWARTTLTRSQRVAEYLLSCVSEIVDYTNAKANRLLVTQAQCDLYSLFRQVEAILKALSSDTQQVSVCVRALGSACVVLDSTKLKQVLLNVGSNCLRFENSVKIQATLTDHELAVFVTALGVHLEIDEDVEQGSVNEGVAIRFEMIQDTLLAMGGTELAFSHDQEGSTVSFTLRVEEASDDSDYSVPDEEMNLWAQAEAMVVDDNALALQIMQEKLKAVGIQCETAVNGQVCVEKLRSLDAQGVRLKVIILDIQMPVLDGWQCALQINRLYNARELKHLPYILGYSAFSSTEEIEKCRACGMNDVLSKPALNAELFARLSKIFNRTFHCA